MPAEGHTVRQPIATERLTLRAWEPGDLEALLAIHGDPERVRWVPFEPRSREQAEEALARKITQTTLREPGLGGIALAILEEPGAAPIGELTFSYESREHSTAELGFMLVREAEGRGYATEAAREMLRVGFKELDFHRVIGRIDARNTASAAVLERLGMRREARHVDNEWIKGEWTSEDVYAILASEWGRAEPNGP